MKVSVVIIAKNSEKTIANCLSSVFEQTRQPDEVIVVDGRSIDKTREIASSFPVKLMIAPQKDTYGVSRNQGVKAATGDVIVFLDSDDHAEKDWLQILTEAINPEDIGMVGAKREYVYPCNWFTEFKWDLLGGRKARKQKASPRKVEAKRDKLVPVSSPGRYLGTSGSAYKREAIEKAGYFNEDMFFGCEDIDLALRIMNLKYKIMFAPHAVIYFNPARSVQEWFKETFYRTGMGYGALRRKYGHYKPPLITPLITFLVALGIFIGYIWNLPFLSLLLMSAFIAFLLWKTSRYVIKTRRVIHSLTYTMLEVLARHLAFFGFVTGYLLPLKLLRRIARR